MKNPVNAKWRIATIILVVVVLSQGYELYRINSELKNVFHYDVEVTLKDKDTGETIPYGGTSGPGTSSRDLFHQTTTYSGGADSRHISGIAYQPREFGFRADGYKPATVMITKETPWSLVVELERKEEKAEQDAAMKSQP